jgi:hypothetical protein
VDVAAEADAAAGAAVSSPYSKNETSRLLLAGGSNAMESIRQPQTSAGVATAQSALRYTESAPPNEVMMEQLEYLLLHTCSASHKPCADCARLRKVSRHLLAPFC